MLPTTKILILEDEEILAENLKSFLSRRSPHVRIAGDVITAIEVLQDFTPTPCATRLRLLGMDGLQTCARILRRKPVAF